MAGGEITSGKFIVPLRLDIYYNVEDIVLAIIEIFVCLGFVGLFLDSLLKTAKDSLKFDKYEHGIEDLIGKKNTEIRNRIKPKWVRKLMTLFTVDRILRFIFCGLFIASFIIYVGIIVFSYNIKPSLRAGDVEYFEDLNQLAIAYEIYIEVTSLTLLFLILYSIKYIQNFQGVRFLQDTMWKASPNIAYYLLLIGLIVFGFAAMAHLAFGHSDKSFSNLLWAHMTIFEMFCGVFRFEEMKKADPLMAPIFFTAAMAIVVFILLNLFIAILVSAYIRVKQKHAEDE